MAATDGTAAAWDAYSATYQSSANLTAQAAHYGPDIADESELRLLGDLKAKRLLDLGCGGGQTSVAFARSGATVIGVDVSAEQLGYARRLAEHHEVKVEFRQADMAELAFLRADSVDAAFSSWALQYVEDLGRVFRQVHRVLRPAAPFVLSLPHPAWFVVDETAGAPVRLARSYFDRSPERTDFGAVAHHHTFASLYTALTRASFRVDLVLEPEPIAGAPRSWFWSDAMDWLPRTLIVRSRKAGN